MYFKIRALCLLFTVLWNRLKLIIERFKYVLTHVYTEQYGEYNFDRSR